MQAIETEHYKIVIAPGDHKVFAVSNKYGGQIVNFRIVEDQEKLEIYFNTNYFNTPESLAYGVARVIMGREILNGRNLGIEETEKQGDLIGEELIDILKQLR